MTEPVNHARAGRLVLGGLWADAGLVMAASAWNGGRAMAAIGDPFWSGVLLGGAVDAGLAVSLIGDQALHLAGRTEPWGRWVRVTTALMSLALNCAVAIRDGHYAQAMFHAFPVVLLVLLAEYAQSSTLEFRDIAAARDAAERVAAGTEHARLRDERAAQDTVRAAARDVEHRDRELAATRREQEMVEHRDARDHTHRDADTSRATAPPRPRTAPRTGTVPPPAPVPRTTARPARTGTVPVTGDLLSRAQEWRTRQLAHGGTAGHVRMQRDLGIPERTAKALIRQLTEPPLRAVDSNR